jgi:NAD(P)H-dependent FMN reductase
MTDVHVAAVAGSLRDDSATRRALRPALDAAADHGATTDTIDLRDLDLPPLDPEAAPTEGAEELTRRVRTADSVLLGTPMYHGSYSSTIKLALDHCGFDEFEETTVGLLAVSGGAFPLTALDHLRSVCRALNAWVLPHQAAVPHAGEQFDDEGGFVDERLEERARVLGRRAVEYAHIEPEPPNPESLENVGAE